MGSTRLPGRVGPVAVIVLATACLITGTASAAPAPDKQTQADQLAQQLDDQGQHIAALDEQFNQARAKADAIDAQLAAIGPKLAEFDRQLVTARQRLAEASVDAYVRGGSSPLLGALIMAFLRNGCQQMGWPNYIQEIVIGSIIMLAVALDRARAKWSERAAVTFASPA